MVEPRGIEALRRFLERLYNTSSEYIFFEHAFSRSHFGHMTFILI